MVEQPSKNYTEDMIATMTEAYTANPTRATVNELAEDFGKTVRSVIAKLSAIGIYQKPVATTKRGEPVVKKEVFVAQIQDALGVEVPSMEKMTKSDLQVLVAAITVNS
jgi:hypothetical protein